MGIEVRPDWWKTLFDGLYLLTDARSVCDEEISLKESEVISRLLSPVPGQKILDLCGGQGRHSFYLQKGSSVQCTVLDFSGHLVRLGLKNAREKGLAVRFIQGDARWTSFPDCAFDHVIVMGNSLGYLPDTEDDIRILRESFRVLKQDSSLLLDITDGEKARGQMVPRGWHEVNDDLVVCRQRELVDSRINARELVFSRKKGLVRDQAYAIRLFTSSQIRDLLRDAGFVDVRILKDFRSHRDDGDYGFMNRRFLAMAKKPHGGGKNR